MDCCCECFDRREAFVCGGIMSMDGSYRGFGDMLMSSLDVGVVMVADACGAVGAMTATNP